MSIQGGKVDTHTLVVRIVESQIRKDLCYNTVCLN
jgi:hypothetical protein